MTKADITYEIQNYPSQQVDLDTGSFEHNVSGTITTNGTIGALTPADILSWSVTFDGTFTFSSSVIFPDLMTSVFATATQITTTGYFVLLNPIIQDEQLSYNYSPHTGEYLGENNVVGYLWDTDTTTLGGNTNWIVAEVVPEPSTLVIAGLASVCGIAYGLARKRRAQRKPRNEP